MAAKQGKFAFRQWGGKRRGAGRPRKEPRPELVGPGVPHRTRPTVARYHPVHVSIRLRNGLGDLRTFTLSRLIENALHAAKRRTGMRVVHYCILTNHLHLIVECEDRHRLARGIQALTSTIARRLNRERRRRGRVFVDRYHAHVLKTPREVRRAVRYVLGNLLHHAGLPYDEHFYDPYSSASFQPDPPHEAPVLAPRTFLLRSAIAAGGP